MENYCLFSKLIPLGSSYFLRNCSLTNMLSFSGIFYLSVSLCFSLGVCQLPVLSLCISNSSLPLLFVYLSSVSCCSSVFSISSLTLQHQRFLSAGIPGLSCLLKTYPLLYPWYCNHLTTKTSPLKANFTERNLHNNWKSKTEKFRGKT